MTRFGRISSSVALFCATASPLAAQDFTFNGVLGLGSRSFFETSFDTDTIHFAYGEVRSRGDLTDRLSYDLRLYGRQNSDGDGGYVDTTVAKLTYTSGNWQFDVGYDLLFWGVAEGRNVVNVINQRDQIRDPLLDQGLGQRMIAARYFGSAVTVEAFVLPHFEVLNFGTSGRPWGLGVPVDDSRSTFEADDGARHIDYALRVSGIAGNLEYAVFAFDGTLRQPEYRYDIATGSLIPHYVLGQQFGIEAQYTAGATLFKLESVKTRPDSSKSYTSTIVGLEYNAGGIFGLPVDTSFFAEYYYDTRQDDPTILYQNDLFLGTQLLFSNRLDTQIELGAIFDLESDGVNAALRVSSRITDSMRLKAEVIKISASDPNDGLFNARNFDQASFGLEWHF